MTDSLNITIVQTEIRWHDVTANLQNIDHLLASAAPTHLILLPEMFGTGFVVDELPTAESAVQILEWMKHAAAKYHAAVAGSIAMPTDQGRKNRLCFVTPDGRVQHYDKRHLFLKSPEPEYFEKGTAPVVFEYDGWKICPQVCYDLRFPVWSRNTFRNGEYRYDLLLYVANWPAVRSAAWNTLLRARAIENQCFVAACNCVGADPQGHLYQGDSQVIAPDGRILAASESPVPQILQTSLSFPRLSGQRSVFPVAEDWDVFVQTVKHENG